MVGQNTTCTDKCTPQKVQQSYQLINNTFIFFAIITFIIVISFVEGIVIIFLLFLLLKLNLYQIPHHI